MGFVEKSDKLYNFDKRKGHRHGGKRRLGCGVVHTFVITLYEMLKLVKIRPYVIVQCVWGPDLGQQLC